MMPSTKLMFYTTEKVSETKERIQYTGHIRGIPEESRPIS
jgi:hypothetical protein